MNRIILLSIALLCASTSSGASCVKDGQRTQSVALLVEDRQLAEWDATAGEIHRVRLPGGFEVGIQIDPTTPEKYREVLAKTKWPSIDELVKITLFDMRTSQPRELSVTWGGANSRQGFGPRGGANGVPELGDQIELSLRKPVCVTEETIANAAK